MSRSEDFTRIDLDKINTINSKDKKASVGESNWKESYNKAAVGKPNENEAIEKTSSSFPPATKQFRSKRLDLKPNLPNMDMGGHKSNKNALMNQWFRKHKPPRYSR